MRTCIVLVAALILAGCGNGPAPVEEVEWPELVALESAVAHDEDLAEILEHAEQIRVLPPGLPNALVVEQMVTDLESLRGALATSPETERAELLEEFHALLESMMQETGLEHRCEHDHGEVEPAPP